MASHITQNAYFNLGCNIYESTVSIHWQVAHTCLHRTGFSCLETGSAMSLQVLQGGLENATEYLSVKRSMLLTRLIHMLN